MKCPICSREVEDKKYRPFCSKRCADIDLGNWFNEKYSFAAQEIDEQDIAELDNLCDHSTPPSQD
ncbi:MAG: DNA gyrase inhibitor YacG [Alphaproteobacteria bacterium]|nr:DNA gyrase inhibitor YacG [Alphaproteobacteria bacterium]